MIEQAFMNSLSLLGIAYNLWLKDNKQGIFDIEQQLFKKSANYRFSIFCRRILISINLDKKYMFCRKDIEFILTAMYRDEIKNISDVIAKVVFNISEVEKLRCNLDTCIDKPNDIWKKFIRLINKETVSAEKAISNVVSSLSEQELKYKLEIEELNLKKKEIESFYKSIIDNLAQVNLTYVQNLILTRSTQENCVIPLAKTRTVQFLVE